LNSFLSWVGGKKALRNVIVSVFPVGCDRYVEVFGGAGWILFHKEKEKQFEVFNDYNADLTNLFLCVKERTMALLAELGFLPLNGRDEFSVLRKFLNQEEFTDEYLKEELELTQHYLKNPAKAEIIKLLKTRAKQYDVRRAAAFFKVVRYSYASGCTSVSCQPCDIRRTFHLIWAANRRLAGVFIENKDFGAVIEHYDSETVFFYCDPPYYKTEKHYEVCFPEEDHIRLFNVLSNINGKFLLSQVDCPFIRELYKDFNIMPVSRINSIAQRYSAGSEFPEVLISNYDLTEREKRRPIQISLLDFFERIGVIR